MDVDRSIFIVRSLAEGVDPHTGEPLPPESPLQHPDTVRALHAAWLALEAARGVDRRRRILARPAGKAWTREEESALAKAFDEGDSMLSLARRHSRDAGEIRARLAKLGRTASPEGAAPARARPLNAGNPWTPAEDGLLCAEFDAGRSIEEMAAAHGRTAGGIRARLIRLGRIQE